MGVAKEGEHMFKADVLLNMWHMVENCCFYFSDCQTECVLVLSTV